MSILGMTAEPKAGGDKCPKCGSGELLLLGFECYRDDATPHSWHDTDSAAPEPKAEPPEYAEPGKLELRGNRDDGYSLLVLVWEDKIGQHWERVASLKWENGKLDVDRASVASNIERGKNGGR